jgi:hypothetical protein
MTRRAGGSGSGKILKPHGQHLHMIGPSPDGSAIGAHGDIPATDGGFEPLPPAALIPKNILVRAPYRGGHRFLTDFRDDVGAVMAINPQRAVPCAGVRPIECQLDPAHANAPADDWQYCYQEVFGEDRASFRPKR